jgi:hypothetical protein
MTFLLTLAFSGAWLLLAAGLIKLTRPSGTEPAVKALTGVRLATPLVRLLGLVEVAIATTALTTPSVLSLGVLGAWYASLSGIAWVLFRDDTDCGCFGAKSTPVTRSHIVTTAILTGAALGSVLLDGGVSPQAASYVLAVASLPIAIGWYAMLVPLPTLESALRGRSS